jgi:hypothetical protein
MAVCASAERANLEPPSLGSARMGNPSYARPLWVVKLRGAGGRSAPRIVKLLD